jgi:pyroglutamyl-peptidase
VIKILVTGFDAFGGEKINPSALILDMLKERTKDIDLVTCQLPTVFTKSAAVVEEAITTSNPHAVISIGQAGGSVGLRVERVALNLADSGTADNEGNRPADTTISPEGPVAYWSTISVKDVVKAIREAGIPASVSYSAGTFVCNHVFYTTCNFVATHRLPIKVGFIHVPYLPEQAVGKLGVASMSLEHMVTALQNALEIVAADVLG